VSEHACESVIDALRAGECFAAAIAERTGKHVETVRRILRGYEHDGVVRRAGRRGTARNADRWTLAR
jgi:DNA-binding IclR family transcriptional regulator